MGQRPPHVHAPDYLTPTTPVPEPEAVPVAEQPGRNGLDPTRYGDWEHGKDGGRIVDF